MCVALVDNNLHMQNPFQDQAVYDDSSADMSSTSEDDEYDFLLYEGSNPKNIFRPHLMQLMQYMLY